LNDSLYVILFYHTLGELLCLMMEPVSCYWTNCH